MPQPIDDVEVPFLSTVVSGPALAIISNENSGCGSSQASSNSPNVIVEALPYNLPPLEEYNFSAAFNEQKIFEDLLEYENELM